MAFGIEQQLRRIVTDFSNGRIAPDEFEMVSMPFLKKYAVDEIKIPKIFHAYGKVRKRPTPEMLRALTEQATCGMHMFGGQGVGNTIWGCAKMGWRPGPRLLDLLEERAVEIAGEFKPIEISNTMWAFATLGIAPNMKMVRGLEATAVSLAAEFKPQDVAHTLWAFATLDIQVGFLACNPVLYLKASLASRRRVHSLSILLSLSLSLYPYSFHLYQCIFLFSSDVSRCAEIGSNLALLACLFRHGL